MALAHDLPAFQQGLAETLRAAMWSSSTAGRRTMTTGCQRSQPISSADAWLIALGTPGALAAKAATQTIPIVFRAGSDPVEIGLVASFNRPAGNITGIANLSGAIVSKRLALLHELLPTVMIATMVNPANPRFTEIETRDLQAAASVLGIRILVLNGGTASEITGAFATLVEQQAGALLISADDFGSCSTRSNHVAGGSLCDTHHVCRPAHLP